MDSRLRTFWAAASASAAILAGCGGSGSPKLEAPLAPPTTGLFTQTTDPSREDYYDQLDHAVKVERVQRAASAAFGKRFAGAIIDRDVTPNLLRIYVIDPTDTDEETLAKVADGNPQVVLNPATFTWRQLLNAKDAIGRLLTKRDVPADVGPDLAKQAVVVGARRLPPELRGEIEAAAGDVPVIYQVGSAFQPIRAT